MPFNNSCWILKCKKLRWRFSTWGFSGLSLGLSWGLTARLSVGLSAGLLWGPSGGDCRAIPQPSALLSGYHFWVGSTHHPHSTIPCSAIHCNMQYYAQQTILVNSKLMPCYTVPILLCYSASIATIPTTSPRPHDTIPIPIRKRYTLQKTQI
jgi:hypothetical protein